MSLMQEMGARALKLRVPLSVQMDVTYRCNERCVHCYLDHDDHGEMTTAEIKGVLDQLAEAGVFFPIFSGGEVFMRMDFFELVEYARSLMFGVKVKTNAFMIGEEEADRLAAAHLDSVQVSIYSHRPEVHDAITLLPRSLERSIAGIRRLRDRGVKVILANVLMRPNFQDYAGVKALARELGAEFTIDPTITPMMDGDRSILSLGIEQEELQQVFRDEGLVGNVDEFAPCLLDLWRKRTRWIRSLVALATPPATFRRMVTCIHVCSSHCLPATSAGRSSWISGGIHRN